METNLIKKYNRIMFFYFLCVFFWILLSYFSYKFFPMEFADAITVVTCVVLSLFFQIYRLKLKCPNCGTVVGFRRSKLFPRFYSVKNILPDNCMMCGYDLTGEGNNITVGDNK